MNIEIIEKSNMNVNQNMRYLMMTAGMMLIGPYSSWMRIVTFCKAIVLYAIFYLSPDRSGMN